jgi:hypothetical protein
MMEDWVQTQIGQSVGFLVDRVSLGRVFLQVLKYSLAIIIPPAFHTQISCVLLTLYSLCSWQHHSITLKEQCLSVCHLVMKKRDGLCNTDFKFILLVAQESYHAVNWRAYLHILSLK